MKTKIASFLTAAVVSLMTLATNSFADAEDGFYDKEHIRGFISIGGDYRVMRDEFQNYVNRTAFITGAYSVSGAEDLYAIDGDGPEYKLFNDYYLGLHINAGAQYKQFLTWFDFNFMPTQVSERPDKKVSTTSESGDSRDFALFDVRWFAYGADWMFGWKLLGENSFINVIPAVGFGFNLINFHLASEFAIASVDGSQTATLRDRYYSTLATTFNTELEVRIELDPIAIGIYGGYRFVRYNELVAEGMELKNPRYEYDTDNIGDTFFFGLRLTWTFRSEWQKKQDAKL